MKNRTIIFFMTVYWIISLQMFAQFSPETLKKMKGAEEFLRTARVVEYEQLGGRFAVTNPYKLTLEKNGRQHLALWKNASGILKGHRENWRWEVAAFRMDKLLDLNMVPPTIERAFQNNDGSCQYWVAYWINLAEKEKKDISVPRNKLVFCNRAVEALPRDFFEKIKSLDYETLGKTMDYYLTSDEKRAVLARRDLIVEDINRRIQEKGEYMVLYQPVRDKQE